MMIVYSSIPSWSSPCSFANGIFEKMTLTDEKRLTKQMVNAY